MGNSLDQWRAAIAGSGGGSSHLRSTSSSSMNDNQNQRSSIMLCTFLTMIMTLFAGMLSFGGNAVLQDISLLLSVLITQVHNIPVHSIGVGIDSFITQVFILYPFILPLIMVGKVVSILFWKIVSVLPSPSPPSPPPEEQQPTKSKPTRSNIATHLVMLPLYAIGFIFDIARGVAQIVSMINLSYSLILMNLIYLPMAYAAPDNNVVIANYKLIIVILVLLIGITSASSGGRSSLFHSDDTPTQDQSFLGSRKTDEWEDLPSSAEQRERSGHRAPRGKQRKHTFLYKHLIKKDTLPSLDQSSSNTNHLSTLIKGIKGLLPTVSELTKIANGINKKQNAEFCHADCNATDINHTELLIIGNFPPSGYLHHLHGILSTWVTVGYNMANGTKDKESRNIPPANCSIHEFFRTFANIMSIEYGVSFAAALIICIQISVWVDILPISLKFDSADDKSKSSIYNKTRKKTDSFSKKYIQGLINNLPNLKCLIILGDEAYKFVQEMQAEGMIPKDIKIFQHSPLIHPTKLLKWGASKREAYWFYECITKTLAHLVNAEPSKQVPKDVLQDKVRHVFPDRQPDSVKGCFIYKAYVGNTVLFITRGYEELTELIRSYKNGSIPDSFNYEDILNSGSRYLFRGLELELIWFDQHDYSEDFGVLNEARMKQWVMKAKKIRDKGWVLKQDTTISNTGGGHLTSATENVNWFAANVMRRRR